MKLSTALLVSVACTAAAGLLLAGCADSPDENRLTFVITPDYNAYIQYVDAYLTRRCGSLDCHGQPGRAYRIFSREGFRDYTVLGPDGKPLLVSGQQPTAAGEQRANFQALVGLEPEEMTRLMARQGENPNMLLFLRKPLKIERHKGGPAMAEEDPGYDCIKAWLNIPVVDGLGVPIEPANRAKLSPNGVRACAEATSFP